MEGIILEKKTTRGRRMVKEKRMAGNKEKTMDNASKQKKPTQKGIIPNLSI